MLLVKKIIMALSIFVGGIIYAQNINQILKDTKPGVRVDTVITFNKYNDLEYLPLTIFKGKQKGPIFTLIAGVHGYEYPPIVATQDILKEIDADQLNGTLIILPIANIGSFYKRTPFLNPIDGKNLNNAFPGDPTSSVTSKIAYWITKEIIPNTEIFLDIHGGDANEDLLPFICYYDNRNNPVGTEKARLLSEASGMEYIVSYPYTLKKNDPAKYAFKQAVQNGITALSIEAGKLGTVQAENVKLIKDAVYNMLNYQGMYKSSDKSVTRSRKYITDQTYIKVPVKGIFYSTLKSGDKIKINDSLGYVTDEFGKIMSEIKSPVDGTILYKVGTPPVNAGETLFCIGH